MGYGRELLKGSTDHLLLSLIRQEPMYGYQLIKEIGKRSRGYFEFKQGTCYTALHRLEREGLIEGKWKRISNGHARRYCYLSLLGRDGVEAKWIAASELEGQLREDLGDGHFSRHVARRIGYSLRTLGLLTHARSKKRTSTGVMHYIQPKHLVNVRDRWGNEALPDATSEGAEPAGAAGSARRHWLKRPNTRTDRW